MRTRNKWMASLLALFLLLGQTAAVALGEAPGSGRPTWADAIENGKEITYSFSGNWKETMLVPQDISAAIRSLLAELEITERQFWADGENGYSAMDLLLNGESVYRVDTVVEDGAFYIDMPAIGAPISMSMEDMPALMERIGRLLDAEMGEDGLYEATFRQMGEQLAAMDLQATSETIDPEEAMQEVIDRFQLQPTLDAIDQWTAETFVGEAFEGELASYFGVTPDSATLYTLTKEDVVELFAIIAPLLKDNDILWQEMLEAVNQANASFSSVVAAPTGETGVGASAEDVAANMQAFLDEVGRTLDELPAEVAYALPEGMEAYYLSCYDAEENPVLGAISLVIPVESYGDVQNSVELYAEWVPDSCNLYLNGAAFGGVTEMGGLEFAIAEIPEETIANEADGATSTTGGFDASLIVTESGGEVLRIDLQAATLTLDAEHTVTSDTSIALDVSQYGSSVGGVLLSVETETLYTGDDFDKTVVADVSYALSGIPLPLMDITLRVASSDPQGAPFATDEMEFVNPAQMSDEAFARWIEKDIIISMAQAGMGMLSKLPADVFEFLFGDMIEDIF